MDTSGFRAVVTANDAEIARRLEGPRLEEMLKPARSPRGRVSAGASAQAKEDRAHEGNRDGKDAFHCVPNSL